MLQALLYNEMHFSAKKYYYYYYYYYIILMETILIDSSIEMNALNQQFKIPYITGHSWPTSLGH
jgi:hypothetical protein